MKRSLFALALSTALLPAAGHAQEISLGFYLDPMNFGSTQTNDFKSVWMHGYFEGNDANDDGILSLNELQVLTTFTTYFLPWTSDRTVRNDFAPEYSYNEGEYSSSTYAFNYDSHTGDLTFTGWQRFDKDAYAISIGNYISVDDTGGFGWKPGATLTVVPVPEPASLSLLGLGLVGLIAQRRLRDASGTRGKGALAHRSPR